MFGPRSVYIYSVVWSPGFAKKCLLFEYLARCSTNLLLHSPDGHQLFILLKNVLLYYQVYKEYFWMYIKTSSCMSNASLWLRIDIIMFATPFYQGIVRDDL